MRSWAAASVLLATAVVAAAVAGAWWLMKPLDLAQPAVEYTIEPGASARDIAQGWVRAGVRTSPWLLQQWFRWSGDARRIKAGSYEIETGTTPFTLLRKMVLGDQLLATLRFAEGWTFRQLRAEVERADTLKPDSAGLSDAELMRAIGAPGVAPEGRFFPDTYAYAKGSSAVHLLQRAYHAMQTRLGEAWADRDPAVPLASADQLLILASIVEKETGRAADRPLIAGVFANRLRRNMPLQTDPTVIYGLGAAFDGNLRKRDLQTDGPYNTYTRNGLPPTPIALPGRDSLRAAARPAATPALYFVARGDGSSQFSATLDEHNRAVEKYQKSGARK